jgi:threonine/homoserine/homoserine lactone efflux protein
MTPFIEGALAGYGIAIPVGAIAVLILQAAMRDGWRSGFAAGGGAASADLIYAGVAGLAGGLIAPLITPIASPLKWISAGVLIGIGLLGLWNSRQPSAPAAGDQAPAPAGVMRTYLQFLALTLINPMTVVYFAAQIIGGRADLLTTPLARVLFIVGAGLASLSWQWLLALFGALAHRTLPPGFRAGSVIFGNLLVIALGIRIVVS